MRFSQVWWRQFRNYAVAKHIYRVIVNEWYKIKQWTHRRVWFFFRSARPSHESGYLGYLVSMRCFTAHSNYLPIMSDLPSSRIWHCRSTGPFQRMRKNKLLKYEEVMQVQCSQGLSEKSFAIFIPQRFLLGWRFSDFLTNARTLVPWKPEHPPRRRPGPQEQIDRAENFFTVHLDARSTDALKQLQQFRYPSHAIIGGGGGLVRWRTIRPFRSVSLSPSLFLVGFSGFRDPVFLNRSGSRLNARHGNIVRKVISRSKFME